MKYHFRLDKLNAVCLLLFVLLAFPARADAQTQNYRENATAMRVYQRLRAAFPKSFFENVDNYYARYDVKTVFMQLSDYQSQRDLIASVRKELDSIRCVRKVSNVEDSSCVTKIQYVMMTYDSVTMQRDFISLEVNGVVLHYQYRANLQGAGAFAKVGKVIPDSYILDRYDSLFYSYAKRKKVRRASVEYQGEYASNIFQFCDRWLNNRTGGYKYVVPNCTEKDFRKFTQLFRLYAKTNNIALIHMTNPKNYEEVEVAILRHDGRAVNIGAKLKGSDLYLVYTLSKENGVNSKNSVLPFGWDEETEPWCLNGQETPKAKEKYVKDGESVYYAVDQDAAFPGGSQAMKSFIDAHLNPRILSDSINSGYNMVQLVVGADGTVHDARIVKNLNTVTDAESIRVVSIMPKWEPAVKNKKKVSCSVIIPIIYRINK